MPVSCRVIRAETQKFIRRKETDQLHNDPTATVTVQPHCIYTVGHEAALIQCRNVRKMYRGK